MIEPLRLDIWDYVVFSILVILSSCVGIYHIMISKRSTNPEEFLVKSTDLGLIPLILSAAATFVSAIGILGFPVEVYQYGAHFMFVVICYLLSIPFGLYTFLPVFYNLKINSIFEYCERRFNRWVRICTSSIMTVQLMLYTSVAVYAPALALNQVTGLNLWASVASIGILCIIYTAMGGIKAVVWVDAIQFTVMIGVMGLIIVKGIVNLGGVSEIWKSSQEGNRSHYIQWKPSSESIYTTGTLLFGGTINFISVTTVSQPMMQRYICNKTLKDAKISYIGAVLLIAIFTQCTTFFGLILYGRYHLCDPLLNGEVTSRDQIVALFSMEILSFCRGLPGVFMAAITCATLSTLSSSLNSLATVQLQDYIKPFFPNLSKSRELKMAKAVAIINGIICMVLVLFAESIGGLTKAIFLIAGITAGPVTAVFTMGMMFPWINSLGALAGLCAGLLLTGWASVGSLMTNIFVSAPLSASACEFPRNHSLYNISSHFENSALVSHLETSPLKDIFPLYTYSPLWYILWSVGIGIPVALVVSLVTGAQNPKDVDSKLLFPWVKDLFQLLPIKVQKYIGYPLEEKYQQISLSNVNGTKTNGSKATLTSESTTSCIMALLEGNNKRINSDEFGESKTFN